MAEWFLKTVSLPFIQELAVPPIGGVHSHTQIALSNVHADWLLSEKERK